MDEINRLPWEHFMQRFGNVVEHGPIVAGAVWARRPFASREDLHRALCEFLDQMSDEGKEFVYRVVSSLVVKLRAWVALFVLSCSSLTLSFCLHGLTVRSTSPRSDQGQLF